MTFDLKHLSFSAYSSYVRCGKAYELERVTRAPRKPAWWFVGGRLVHEMTEAYDRALFFGESVNIDVTDATLSRLHELMDEEVVASGVVSADWQAGGRAPNKQRYEFWSVEGPKMVQRYIDWRKDARWPIWEFLGAPGIEFDASTTIGDEPIKAFIDRLFVPNGELSVLDVKTGSRVDKEPLQLGLYALAMENLGLPRPKYGYIWKARKGELYGPILLDRYDKDLILKRFSAARKGIEGEIFLPNVNDFCSSCGVRDFCYAVGGEQSAAFDSLHPEFKGAAA